MLVLLVCGTTLEAAVPGAWLLVVPAALPFLNFSPWTGWVTFEEMDILLLALLAGGYGRWGLSRSGRCAVAGARTAADRRHLRLCDGLCLVLAVTGGWALLRGVADAGGWVFDWFGGYEQAMNGVRVFKSVLFAVLLWPLLSRQLCTQGARAQRRFAVGMALGLTWVCLAVLWERARFVGLGDFSSNYRTVATFWEMHVGGAAIDAYLAMATPFAVWALLTATRLRWWLLAAVLTLLTGYACLTTFSRGVYLALGVQVLVLGGALLCDRRWLQRSSWFAGPRMGWRGGGMLVVVLLLVAEVAAVLAGGDSFMDTRIASSRKDMRGRWEHWQSGLALLQSPLDWLVGKGLGRMPADYSAQVPGERFSGRIDFRTEPRGDGRSPDRGFVVLRTPGDWDVLPGAYALTQRVNLSRSPSHVVVADVRVHTPVTLAVHLCQRHLLYNRDCQAAALTVGAPFDTWQTVRAPLLGPDLGADALPITVALSVDTPGVQADIGALQLLDGRGAPLLGNGDFSQRMARWFPAAKSYFLPWHIDNLFLEVLIERGVLGVVGLGALIAWALVRFLLHFGPRSAMATSMTAGLLGVLVVGLVSSVMDVPRVALLLYVLSLFLVGTSAGQSDAGGR